ncbi:MAG: hypothetical protein IJ014_04220 [Rikenellaceae bacterium]|nr:hypothetical protein [Rikenellaceae bacterium]
MTKKLYLLMLAAVCAISASAQNRWYNTPDSVSLGNEPSRGDVISYASADDAVRKTYHRSQYLVPVEKFIRRVVSDGQTSFEVYASDYKLPFAWLDRELLLHIGKVSSAYELWINGTRVGYTHTASTPTEWDITRYSVEGNNTLEIRITTDCISAKLEDGRPQRQATVDGEVYLLAQPKVRVRDVSIRTEMNGTEGLLSLGVILKSHLLNDKEYRVWYELISPRGEVVAADNRRVTLSMREEDTVTFFRRMPDIMTWSHEQPCLYTLVVKTQHEGRFKEYVSFNIGFRSIAVDNDRAITLNGVPLRIVRKDYTPSNDMAQVAADITRLLGEGVTMLNVVGAPQNRSFYNLCDSLGMYVCASADINTRHGGESRRRGGNPANDPAMWPHYKERTLALYHSTKNYPCVIMYSLAANPANGYNTYESYLMLKGLETSRPIVLQGSDEWNNDSLNMRRMESLRRTNLDHWVAVLCERPTSGQVTIANTRHYTPLLGDVRYTIRTGRKTVAEGTLPVRVLPKGEAVVNIPMDKVPSGKLFELNIEVVRPTPVDKYEVGADRSQDGSVRLAHKTFKGVL